MAGLSKRATTLVGAGCAVLCAVCVFLYLHQVRGEAQAARSEALERYGGEQIEVCVATKDIAVGETVGLSSVKTMLWVSDLLPEDVATSVDEVLGRQATSRILAGEAISLKRFESQSTALDVPAGLSAVSVPAKDVQAVGGAIMPGMKVNIYATGDSTTRLLAQDILVLATSSSASGETGDATVTWVAVAVEPALVEELVAAAQNTQLYFVLPGTQVDTTADAQESTQSAPSTVPDASAEATASPTSVITNPLSEQTVDELLAQNVEAESEDSSVDGEGGGE